jgi:hypothetical protein
MQFDHCISSFLKWLKTKKSAHPQVCAFSVSNPFWELNFQRMSNHAGYTITGKRSGSQAPVVQDFIHLCSILKQSPSLPKKEANFLS